MRTCSRPFKTAMALMSIFALTVGKSETPARNLVGKGDEEGYSSGCLISAAADTSEYYGSLVVPVLELQSDIEEIDENLANVGRCLYTRSREFQIWIGDDNANYEDFKTSNTKKN